MWGLEGVQQRCSVRGISPEKKCLQFVSGSRGNPEQGMVQKIAEESGGR